MLSMFGLCLMLLYSSRRQRYQANIILNVVNSLLHRIVVIIQEYNVLARRRSLFEGDRLVHSCVSSRYYELSFSFFPWFYVGVPLFFGL